MNRRKENRLVRFSYMGGEPIFVGDVVDAAGQRAIVEKVIQPDSQDARDFSCPDTGGLLLAFENSDLQLWPQADEDLEFIRRGT